MLATDYLVASDLYYKLRQVLLMRVIDTCVPSLIGNNGPVSLVFWKLKPTQPQGRGGGYNGKDHRAGVVSVKSEREDELGAHIDASGCSDAALEARDDGCNEISMLNTIFW